MPDVVEHHITLRFPEAHEQRAEIEKNINKNNEQR